MAKGGQVQWICVCGKDSKFYLDHNIWVGNLDDTHIGFQGCRPWDAIDRGQKEHEEERLEVQLTGSTPVFESELETTNYTKRKQSEKCCAACGANGDVLDFQVRELYDDKAIFIHEFSETDAKGVKMRLFCILSPGKGKPSKFFFLKQDRKYSDNMALMNMIKKAGEEQDESYSPVGRSGDPSARETPPSTRSRRRSFTLANDVPLDVAFPEIFGDSARNDIETGVSTDTGHLDSPTEPTQVQASFTRNKRVYDFGLPTNNKRPRAHDHPTDEKAPITKPPVDPEARTHPRARIAMMVPPSRAPITGLSGSPNNERVAQSSRQPLEATTVTSLGSNIPPSITPLQDRARGTIAEMKRVFYVTEQRRLPIQDFLKEAGMSARYLGQPVELVEFNVQELVVTTDGREQTILAEKEYNVVGSSTATEASVGQELVAKAVESEVVTTA